MSRWFERYGFADVADDLIIGAYPLDSSDVKQLAHLGVVHVLNLASDAEYPSGRRAEVTRALAAAGIDEKRLDLEDFGHLPAAELEAGVTTVVAWLGRGERTYVHCRAGWQRSAAVAAGALAIMDDVDIETALVNVQRRKPTADPLAHQRAELKEWWSQRTRPTA